MPHRFADYMWTQAAENARVDHAGARRGSVRAVREWFVTVLALDTHEGVKELQAAGFTDVQAEAVTRVVRRAQDVDLSDLATKGVLAAVRADLAAVKAELQAEIAAVRSEVHLGLAGAKADLAAIKASFERSLADTKTELLKWITGAIGLQTVLILGAVVTLVRMMP